MLGGIIFQLSESTPQCPLTLSPTLLLSAVAVCVYLTLASEFLLRYHLDKPVSNRNGHAVPKSYTLDRAMKYMILGLGLDGIFILIRSIYRTIVRHRPLLRSPHSH